MIRTIVFTRPTQPVLNKMFYRSLFIFLLQLLLIAPLSAADAPEEIVVIGVTPARGSELPESKIPYNVQSASAAGLADSQSLDVTDYLNRNFLSISINDAQNNPLQPDVQYRGFTASPLLGLAQGMTVHENGVRINEPLGDTVNWDLIPASAIYSINLIGGANPLFGLNTLGGALSIEMKNGFNTQGHQLEVSGGSFNRIVTTLESGGNKDGFAWYGNLHYFREDGWRELSPSNALNFYGSLGWQGQRSELQLNLQHGNSSLNGNGPLPQQLLAINRTTVFTAPDITRNDLYMVSADVTHTFTDRTKVSGNVFYRDNQTHSFNGDLSNYSLCDLSNGSFLVRGIEPDQLDALGLDKSGICQNNVLNAADPASLETALNAMLAPGATAFNIVDLTSGLSGTGVLADAAVNNISDLSQRSYGTDLQATFTQDLFGRGNQLISGFAWYKGVSGFVSRLELSGLDPVSRTTSGLGTGTFVDEAATNIETQTETFSLYATDTIDLTEKLVATVSGRFNHTRITLADQSGQRPELNGQHSFSRFNPAIGITYQLSPDINLYGGYSESSRAPTPIELSCNNSVYDTAVANAVAAGNNPDDVEYECRLPNAFLSDPPLQQVVARNFDLGIRGKYLAMKYRLGFFHTVNNNDIIFQTTGRATGLFANVNQTQRAGFESSFTGNWKQFDWFINYSYIEATFEDNFDVLSPNHPLADDNGHIRVSKGDRIPGVPDHQLKFGTDYYYSDTASLGLEFIYNSAQYLRGDESNQLPPVGGHTLVNLRGRYRLNHALEVFARINNVLDNDYATFGLLGENPADTGIPRFAQFSSPRFLGPGAPRSIFAGIRITL